MTETEDPAGTRDATPDDSSPDDTLAGYFEEHNRPPAFSGPDGEPYTVSPEAELTPNLDTPFEGYLVFPRWAATGAGVVGHVETGTLVTGASEEEVLRSLGRLRLTEVKDLLDQAVRRRVEESTKRDRA